MAAAAVLAADALVDAALADVLAADALVDAALADVLAADADPDAEALELLEELEHATRPIRHASAHAAATATQRLAKSFLMVNLSLLLRTQIRHMSLVGAPSFHIVIALRGPWKDER